MWPAKPPDVGGRCSKLLLVSRTKKKLVVSLLGAGVALGAWSMTGSEPEEAGLFANHVWVNRMPEHERDMVRFFIPIQSDGNRVGAAGRVSAWRQLGDLFLWAREGDRLSLYFGQEQVHWKPQVKTWRCEREAPEGFELCLKIWDGRHTVLLYSRDEWEVDPKAPDPSAHLRVAIPELPVTQPDTDLDVHESTEEPPFLRW
jgi:hypothetical protein